MRKTFTIAMAFIGVIVGAGFASGQEILQYFTSFGMWGVIGAIISTALFAYMGMVLLQLGSRLKSISHRDAIYTVSGRILGTIIDYIIIFTLFGVGVVMIAGAGSNLNQQFGLPYVVGTTLMTLIVLIAGMARLNRFVAIIGSITPFLILIVIILAIYSIFTQDNTYANLNITALEQPTTLPNWLIGSINYVSFNIAVGASMAIVMGGAEPNEKIAKWGGLLGGLGIGVMIILSHFAIFSKIESVEGYDMPMLQLANEISPILGILMSIVLFGMIFSTGASMFFSFAARFYEVGTPKFKGFLVISLVAGFILSFVGFTDLVGSFYPLIGYLGLFLIVALIVAFVRMRRGTL